MCKICGKAFKSSPHLERHSKLHSQHELKPFKCDLCELSFREKYNLKKHIDGVHENQETFSCDKCDKIFNRQKSLLRHKDIRHNENPQKHECSICGNIFTHKEHLRKHELCVHVDATHECQICQKKFKDSGKLTRHLGTVHKKDKKHHGESF